MTLRVWSLPTAWTLLLAIAIAVLPSQSFAAGKKLLIKGVPGNPASRKVIVEGPFLGPGFPPPDTYFEDYGARLRVITYGTTPSDQTFVFTGGDWFEHKGAVFSFPPDAPSGVKKVIVPDFRTGKSVKIILSGKTGALNIVPPNSGTSAQVVLYTGDGSPYACWEFGGAAGGTVIHDDAKVWEIKNAPTVLNACPAP